VLKQRDAIRSASNTANKTETIPVHTGETIINSLYLLNFVKGILFKDFLADRTNGRAYATVLRL